MEKQRFTIILTPHNRPKHLFRVLKYYQTYDIKIIIVDSSINKYDLWLPKSDNIIYHHCPSQAYAKKIKFALNLVTTPYVMLHAEDDFYIPDSIRKCLNFLDKNKEYSSCQGMFTSFCIKENRIKHKISYYFSFRRNVNESLPTNRIISLTNTYFQLFYAIHRTNSLIETFKFAEKKITNLFAIEILIGFSSLIQGKHKVLDDFYGCREIIPNSAGRSTKNFFFFTKENEYKTEYKEMTLWLSERLAEVEKTSVKEATTNIIYGIENYFFNIKNKKRSFSRIVRFLKKTYIRLKILGLTSNPYWKNIKHFIINYPTK